MEKSLSEKDALHSSSSFRSPPRRRRSTFFERRDSLVSSSKNTDTNSNKNVTDTRENHTQELQRYYEKLTVEKEQWKKEVKGRRNKYHDLMQQYQLAAKAPSRSRMSYSSLLNEDIEFLKGKVGITKLVESQMKLHKSVKEVHALFKRAMELDDFILSDSEDKVKKISEHILDNSTVET